jgi:hypothetical protein
MMDANFWARLTKSWEEADLHAEGARTWFGEMVEKEVNMGTTLDLLWLAKFGGEAVQRDPDRRLIRPMALARQREMFGTWASDPIWMFTPDSSSHSA